MLTHEELLQAIPNALSSVDLPGWGPKLAGKVRDIYSRDGQQVLITTDRVSAFDRVLGVIPFKGQVLNQLSAWWFDQTRNIVENHVVVVPDPNVTIGREAEPLPVEVVVRGYITGVTQTSLWYLYQQGERRPYGILLPDGLRKNDPLPVPIITPTTKATGGAHDEQLTRDEILEGGLVAAPLWEQVEAAALALFARGQAVAWRAGLILVDTKYEFGLAGGRLVVIDEIHTPDSSRFWTLDSYGPGREPENFDKEYLREWFAGRGYRGDGQPPAMSPDFVARVAARYIAAYERLTGCVFVPGEQPAAERIARNLRGIGRVTTMDFMIEPMKDSDWGVVQAIYREGIATGHATFETDAPDWEAWNAGHLRAGRLVARADGQVAGWAALSPVSSRCVYAGVAEVSIYVSASARGQGIGKALLRALIEESERAGIWMLQAGIFPENAASITLHQACGFREVGRRERLGQMNGVWRDVVLMERRSKVVGI